MSVRKNQSQFQNMSFPLINNQILIDFNALTFREKETFNFCTSLPLTNKQTYKPEKPEKPNNLVHFDATATATKLKKI